MAVPAVNSVPDSAGCPRAHQRRVPPTSPAFPRPPPRSGPHPQPPGPSRVFSVPSCPLVSLPVPTWPPPSPWPPPEVGPGHFRPDFLRHDANRKSRRRAAALTCPPVYAARPERDAAKKGFRPLGVPPMVGTSLSPRIPKSQRGQAERDCGAWVQPPCSIPQHGTGLHPGSSGISPVREALHPLLRARALASVCVHSSCAIAGPHGAAPGPSLTLPCTSRIPSCAGHWFMCSSLLHRPKFCPL